MRERRSGSTAAPPPGGRPTSPKGSQNAAMASHSRVHRNSRGLPGAPRRRNPDAPRRQRPAAVLRRVGERRGADATAGRGRRAALAGRYAQPYEGGRVVPYAPTRFGWGGGHGRAVVELVPARVARARISSEAPPCELGAASRSRARATPPRSSARRRGGARLTGGRRSRGGCARCRGGSRRRATTLVRDPLKAEGSPKYLAPTRPVPGHGRARRRGAGRAAATPRCRRARPATTTSTSRRRATAAPSSPSSAEQAHSRTFAVACCVCGGGAGGDTLAASLPTRRNRRATRCRCPRASSSSGSKTAISSSTTTGRRRARGSAGRRRTSSDLARGKDAKGWPLPKTMATKGQSFGGAMLERNGRRQPGPPR